MEIFYHIEIDEGEVHQFKMEFEKDTYLYVPEVKKDLPEWTELEVSKCDNCPVKGEVYCPAAVNIFDMVSKTNKNISHERVKVVVKTKDRSYIKKTDLQSALFSLMGMALATSRCPHFKFLRPMAMFHLPFSTLDDTLVRTIGFYLTQKYFKNLNGTADDKLEIDGLKDLYNELEAVNTGLAARINLAAKGDANKNAIVTLNLFDQMFSMAFRQDFSMIKKYFDPITQE
jgi:hypothetical protein